MASRAERYPSDYFKASDLPANGKTVVIAKIEMEEVGQDRQVKTVIYFRGEDKRLVCNPTNWDLAAGFLGDNDDLWIGKSIVIYPTTTPFAGKQVPCIRIRRPRQTAQPQVPRSSPPIQQRRHVDDLPPPDEFGDPGFDPE